MLFKIPLIIIIAIYIISTIIALIAIYKIIKKILKNTEQIASKFPDAKNHHTLWIMKITLNSFAEQKTMISNPETPDSIENEQTIFKKILAFSTLILTLPTVISYMFYPIFKNSPINTFLNIIFDYLYPISIILFFGFGISEYNNILSIALIIFYLITKASDSVYIFNKITNNKFSKISYIKILEEKSCTLSCYINLLIAFILSFASIYYNLYQIDKTNFICNNNHFGIIDSIYFSIVTLATVGYGDISPNSNIAKILVSIEILASIFMLIFLASTYMNKKMKENERK